MNRKTVRFGSGTREGGVAYLIDGNTIYFTQTDGTYSSINAAEEIVEKIAQQEKINWKEFRWIDIQQKGRYSEDAQDELIFERGDTPDVSEWKFVKVPDEVLQVLL